MAKKEYKKPLVYVQKGNGKKTYHPPKATVYKAEKKPKSNNSTKSGGVRFSASTTVFGAVSLLLMIGLIATVFFAYDNSQRAEGEPFAYFSPATFLKGLSSDETVTIPANDYQIRVEQKTSNFITLNFVGYLTYNGVEVQSDNYLGASELSNGEQFVFTLGGTEYYTRYYESDLDILPEYHWHRWLYIPEITMNLFEMPDFSVVSSAWSQCAVITDEENGKISFVTCLRVTGEYIGDFLIYQGNLLQHLLPWNSVQYSNDVPADGVVYDDSWKVWE